MSDPRLLWIGTYTAATDPRAAGVGVYRAWLDPATGALSGGEPAAAASSPSFLAVHPHHPERFYAVNERAEGTVSGFGSEAAVLRSLGSAGTCGGLPCHVLVHPAGRHIVACDYADGRVSVHRLLPCGAPEEPLAVLRGSGSGPVRGRQDGPHAHSSALAPGGEYLLVADLGADVLRRYRFDADAADPVSDPGTAIHLEPGTGPRHMAVHPSGHIYVVGELDARVHVLVWDPASATARETAVLPAGADPAGLPSEIALSADASRLYVANRGPDTVTAFEVTDGGAGLRRLAEVPCGGTWPRHFALAGEWLIVANQQSAELTVLRLDGSGVPQPTPHRLSVPDPACVLPA
ncbi:lactonase family protein [Streptomonospora nanhaiensis]|uniref:6-phosphogluconolactonase (Cycloisomerase 2 family) n=1 Tax=Streptomonospora nanhaiensis TaxID=1323731 RepID=A0A853BM48_9ACTN|nr:lactonase family protein [Streptomonospora nanhaiensis]MBV2363273.1 lactonase family protein [Streptomonospora nanhaiensis]MBX9389899.1 lactonase family protein [Streptomonospora nanhaiensis]NYI95631.1 6-phosphogluconolactonase (cycloisomerase 2 family) [Streptomonospora nanhaiensis]